MNGHPIRPFDTIICVSEFWASQLRFFCVQTMQLWAPGATYKQKGASKKKAPKQAPQKQKRAPPKKVPETENRQARNHPIWLLGSSDTQKTGSGVFI